MKRSIEKLRLEYGNIPLLEENLHADPIAQFSVWLEEAIVAKVMEPNGTILSTVSPLGHPSARTLLLKEIDKHGFIFFTRYSSRKGEQLSEHPFASLTFWWKEIYRQVCVEGKIEKTSRSVSNAYFAKRPKGAQLATLASNQSTPLASRKELDESFDRMKQKYRGKKIPCPISWGGYRLIPDRFEFWQGRKNRLHDRFLYVRADGEWILSRLAP